MRALVLAIVITLLVPIKAHAVWHEASGEHFVVYANQSPKNIQRYAEKLERYHAALGFVYQASGDPPSPSNRVSVYVVKGARQVKKLYGDGASRYLNGFYKGRAGGSVAIVPRVKSKAKGLASSSEQTLLHEYAHHFMRSNTESRIPRWYTEGFAEFYATATFGKDGSVGLGLPANHRAYELNNSKMVPLEEIFDTRLYLENKSSRYDNFYGRSWLLYHYLFFSKERRGQIDDYIKRLQEGQGELDAARLSFGSLAALNRELNAYKRRKMLSSISFPSEKLTIKPVTVRQLNAGEAAIISVVMRSKLGVTRDEANELLPEAREVAEAYPSNPVVLGALAEAEVDAGNYSEAIAAANAAIAIDANSIQAHIQKGFAMANAADEMTDGSEKTAAWSSVRRHFVKANRLETENPLPLVHFYWSYTRQKIEPTKNAVEGLEWALSLAPFDGGVRWLAAQQQMEEKRYADARDTLVPIAFGPHVSDDNAAKKLLREAEQKLAGETGEVKGSSLVSEQGKSPEV